MKNILGLDLGTNSIGWAKVSVDENGKVMSDIQLGSRIIPMTQDVLSKFDNGQTQSQTAERTGYRGHRRLLERSLQRRERLHRALHVMGMLPPHYEKEIGWNRNEPKTYGKFIDNAEPKIAWERGEDGKMQFRFMDSFHEMLADFAHHQPALVADGKRIPLDWTLYYLRKKALTEAVTKAELAWILLSFNQKRGYYQLRGEEEEEDITKRKEYHELEVERVDATGEKKGDKKWYNIWLKNGWLYRRQSSIPLDNWVGKIKKFIVTTEYEADGITIKKDKEGNERRSFRSPSEDDWTLRKKCTEQQIEQSGKTVGAFIYDHLLAEPSDKIRGNYVRTIERNYYKDELRAILQKQREFHEELRNKTLVEACAKELYLRNETHQKVLMQKDMVHLLLDDLIFYQRPLKSKKSLIADCPYEKYNYTDKETGEIKTQTKKCAAKSNPYFQEFRLWQFVQNLRLYKREDDADVTTDYLKTTEDYANLFDFLNDRKEIKQSVLLKNFFKIKKTKVGKESIFPIRWNYIEDEKKTYPCNETRYELLSALKRANIEGDWLTKEREYRMWHLLYSVEHKDETRKALEKWDEGEDFINAFLKVKPFKKDYTSYSEKAIKKLLTVMRMGKYWEEDIVKTIAGKQIEKIINGEIDEKLKERIRNAKLPLENVKAFSGLPVWLACYVIYSRHSETTQITKWESPESLMSFIKGFKQGEMRNPIVEQCVLETLRTVHDIWKAAGHIDEIHIELGREMKLTAEERQHRTSAILNNEATNLRIKQLLMELKNDNSIENVRPHSPMQQDILRIYEEGALNELKAEDAEYNDILKISHTAQPTQDELIRYKAWLEQKYRSPYTGKPIPLGKLFTAAYEIEHVIPKARYFDDSLSNKVICEAEVNKTKGTMLGYEFIKEKAGTKIHCAAIGDVVIFSQAEYEQFVKEHYANNTKKRNKLLMDEIPQDFINRQLNDSRYISKMVKSLLSNIVREQGESEATSKNVILCTGGITDRLKKDWGMNDVWNNLIYHRFERMNKLTESELFGHWENKNGKRVFQTTMPIELQRGFNKKRIDHRHHAMDALIIACASRNIINYLNNESAADEKKRYDLKAKLCGEKGMIKKPWDSFTQDAQKALSNVVVSFRNYVRIINKATNFYERIDEKGKHTLVPQKTKEMWAIRKPLHKETYYGKVNLKRPDTVSLSKALEQVERICDKELRKYILQLKEQGMNNAKIKAHFKALENRWNEKDVSKIDIITFTNDKGDKEAMVASRKPLDTSFDEKAIRSISDTGIQKILLNYLKAKNGNEKLAFSPEGIDEMNKNISLYNDGKPHQPIRKVRVTDKLGLKFQVGQQGNKKDKYVKAEVGTNLYFAIYKDEEGNRVYNTPEFSDIVERLKQGLKPVKETYNNAKLLFTLSPNDLVYVPTEDEMNIDNVKELNPEHIYKMVSSTENRSFFIQHRVAKSIQDKYEFSSKNKMERAVGDTDVMIKSVCWKLEVDRLGNITNIIK